MNGSLLRKKFSAVLASGILCLVFSFSSGAQTLIETQMNAWGSGNQYARDVAVDGAGNQYVVGSFENATTFDGWALSPTFTSAGLFDGFVAKYDKTTSLVWLVLLSGTANDDINSIAVYPDGNNGVNVYVTGSFTGSATIARNYPSPSASFPVNGFAPSDVTSFIAKIDNSGTPVWRTVAGNPSSTTTDIGNEIAVNTNGTNINVFTTGSYRGSTTFYHSSSGGITIGGSTTDDHAYITCYTDNGLTTTCNWVNSVASAGNDAGLGIDADASGNVYVTGIFRGNPATVSTTSGAGASLALSGVDDIFVLRYNNAGVLGWATRFGGSSTIAGSDVGGSIAVDRNGKLYITGQFRISASFGAINLTSAGSWDVFVVKLDNFATSFSVAWAVRGGSSGADRGYDIAVDNCGMRCYVAGDYRGTATFAPMTLSPFNALSPNQDGFLAEYNTSNGTVAGVYRSGGSEDADALVGIDANAVDNVFFTGRFASASTELFSNSATTGTYDSFHAQWDHFNWPSSGSGTATNTGVAVNQCDVFSSGTMVGSATFGITTLNATGGSTDAYLTRSDKFGNYNMFVPVTDGAADEVTMDQAGDQNGGQLVVGYGSTGAGTHFYNYTGNASTLFNETGFLCKVNGVSGNVMWAVYVEATGPAGPGGMARVNGVTTDALGNIFICGEFNGKLRFVTPDQGLIIPPPIPPASNTVRNFFFARFSAGGHLMWFNTGGSSNTDKTAYGIAVDNSSHLYVTGKFSGISTFDILNSAYTLTAAFGSDLFVSHYTYTSTASTLVNVLPHAAGAFTEVGNDVTARSSQEVYFTGTDGRTILGRCNMSTVTPSLTWLKNSTGNPAVGYEVEYVNGYVFMAGACGGTTGFGSLGGGCGLGMIVKYNAATGNEECQQCYLNDALDMTSFSGTNAGDFGDILIVSGGWAGGQAYAYIGKINFESCSNAYRTASENSPATLVNEEPIANIFPNPFHGSATLQIDGTDLEKESATLQIFDMSGRLVFTQQNITTRQTTIAAENFAPGFYIYRVEQNSHEIGNGKIVITD